MPVGLYASSINKNNSTINNHHHHHSNSSSALLLPALTTSSNITAGHINSIITQANTENSNFFKLNSSADILSNGCTKNFIINNNQKSKANATTTCSFLNESFFNDLILTSDDLNMKLNNSSTSTSNIINNNSNSTNNATHLFGSLNGYGQNMNEVNGGGDSKPVLIVVLTTPPASSSSSSSSQEQLISIKKSAIQQQQQQQQEQQNNFSSNFFDEFKQLAHKQHQQDFDKFTHHNQQLEQQNNFNNNLNSFLITNKPTVQNNNENLNIVKAEANASLEKIVNSFNISSNNNSNTILTVKHPQLDIGTIAKINNYQHDITTTYTNQNDKNLKNLNTNNKNDIQNQKQNQNTSSTPIQQNQNALSLSSNEFFNEENTNINNCQIDLNEKFNQFLSSSFSSSSSSTSPKSTNNSMKNTNFINSDDVNSQSIVLNNKSGSSNDCKKVSNNSTSIYFSYPSPSPTSSSSSSSFTTTSTSSNTAIINDLSGLNEKLVNEKNNIDFAIDAVIDRCRQEQDQEEELAVASALRKIELDHFKSNNINSPMITDIKSINEPSSPISTANHSSNLNTVLEPPSTSASAPMLLSLSTTTTTNLLQPMSKSSKARTSYISSLIANREKTCKDEEKKQIDDKQKRISQNILSILATVSNSTTNSTNTTPATTSITNKSNNNTTSVPVLNNASSNNTSIISLVNENNKAPLIQPPIKNDQLVPAKQSTLVLPAVKKTTKPKQTNNKQQQQSQIVAKIQPQLKPQPQAINQLAQSPLILPNIQTIQPTQTKTASLNELITMINSSAKNYNQKQFSLIEKVNNEATMIVKPTKENHSNIDFFINTTTTTNHPNTNTNLLENKTLLSKIANIDGSNVNLIVNTNTNTDTSELPNNHHQHNINSFLECTNLKRLLSQPLDQNNNNKSINLNMEANEQNAEIEKLLIDSSFDKKLVKIEIKNEAKPIVNQTILQQNEKIQIKKKQIKRIKSIENGKQQSSIIDIKSSIDAVALAANSINTCLDVKPAETAKPKPNKRKTNPSTVLKGTIVNEVTTKIETEKTIEQKNQIEKQHLLLPAVKTKKLKTIADIVKHNSCQQMNNTRLLHQQASSQSSASSNNSNTHSLLSSDSSSNLLNNSNNNIFQDFNTSDLITNNNNENNTNLTVSWINNNNNNNNSNILLNTFYTNESVQNHHQHIDTDNNMVNDSDINIDHLLEIELAANQQSPIDKYIDLDEIDVNPLDCYRNNNNNNIGNSNNNLNSLQNTSSTNLDEFNLQFSVCSSSSSGFSEPSSFSCSSSMSSTNSGYSNNNSGNIFSSSSTSESQSSPITYQYDHHHSPSLNNSNNSTNANNSAHNNNTTKNKTTNNNIKLSLQSNNLLMHQQHSNLNHTNTNDFISNSVDTNNSNKPFKPCNSSNFDWNIIEFTTTGNSTSTSSSTDAGNNNHDLIQDHHHYHNTHELINDQPNVNNTNNYNNNCGDNMFGSFNFFNDEIKLEI